MRTTRIGRSVLGLGVGLAAVAAVALGEAGFDRARDEGATLPLHRVIDDAIGITPDAVAGTGATGAAEESAALSPRELEVLRLIVEGKTDREIAEALFVSRRTAASHVASIFAKLDVGSRAAAAAYAVRRRLA